MTCWCEQSGPLRLRPAPDTTWHAIACLLDILTPPCVQYFLQVVTIMAESGADLMLSDTRGRRPYVIALEEAEKGRSECLVTLTSALSSASLASMLGPPSAADGPPPKTRDGLELITLTRLRAVYPPGAAKAMNGLIVSMDRRSIAGVSHQVLADFRPVDVPSGSLSDGIDTIFEQVALDRDTDMAG